MALSEAIKASLAQVRDAHDAQRLRDTYGAIVTNLASQSGPHRAGLETLVVCAETALKVGPGGGGGVGVGGGGWLVAAGGQGVVDVHCRWGVGLAVQGQQGITMPMITLVHRAVPVQEMPAASPRRAAAAAPLAGQEPGHCAGLQVQSHAWECSHVGTP